MVYALIDYRNVVKMFRTLWLVVSLEFEHFDLISLADKSIRRKNERFIGL